MQIGEEYSIYGGIEFLLVQKPLLWKELKDCLKEPSIATNSNRSLYATITTGKIFHKFNKWQWGIPS